MAVDGVSPDPVAHAVLGAVDIEFTSKLRELGDRIQTRPSGSVGTAPCGRTGRRIPGAEQRPIADIAATMTLAADLAPIGRVGAEIAGATFASAGRRQFRPVAPSFSVVATVTDTGLSSGRRSLQVSAHRSSAQTTGGCR